MYEKYEFLKLEIDAKGVAFVELNRPQVHNAFDSKLIRELTHVFGALDEDSKVRMAVLSGCGKSFCAGGDLNWMRSMKNFSREENVADSKTIAAMYSRISSFRKPLIGVIHGFALGGGSGLVAVCDYVLASENAQFGFTETHIGILPAVIAPYVIEKIGISAARAYFISGMKFSARIAKEIGLVHRTVPSVHLYAASVEVIGEFLKAAPQASKKAKTLIDTLLALSSDKAAAQQASIQAISDARVSEEGQEGMDALLTGRKAKWVI